MKSLLRLLRVIVCLVIGSVPAAEKQPELARLIVLDYRNETGSEDYDYLSESLNTAVDKGLEKRFVYKKIDGGGVKLPGNPDKADSWKKILVKEKKADIVVYGSYKLVNNGKEVEIISEVLLVSEDQHFRMEPVRSTLDVKIFAATDKSAALVVERMSAVAAGRNKDADKPAASDGKVAIIAEQKSQIFDGGWEIRAEIGIGRGALDVAETGTDGVITDTYDLTSDSLTALDFQAGVLWRNIGIDAIYNRWFTADSNYESSLNPLPVSTGPARGDLGGIIASYYWFTTPGKWQYISTGAGYVGGSFDINLGDDLGIPIGEYNIQYSSPALSVSGATSAAIADGWNGVVMGSLTVFNTQPQSGFSSPANNDPLVAFNGDSARAGYIFRVSFGIQYSKIPGVLFLDFRQTAIGFEYASIIPLPTDINFNNEFDKQFRYYGISYQHRLHL